MINFITNKIVGNICIFIIVVMILSFFVDMDYEEIIKFITIFGKATLFGIIATCALFRIIIINNKGEK